MFGYKLDIETICENTVVSDEPYGEWQDECTNTFKGLIRDDHHPDVSSFDELETLEDSNYLVWLEYSTGDSFGWALRGSTEAIGIFTNKEDALRVKESIKLDSEYRSNRDMAYNTSFEVFLSDRTLKLNYVPWCGVFESLDEVHIEEVNMLSVNKKHN